MNTRTPEPQDASFQPLSSILRRFSRSGSKRPPAAEQTPEPTCEICRGRGFVRLSGQSPRNIAPSPCRCTLETRNSTSHQRLLANSNIGALSRMSLRTFAASTDSPTETHRQREIRRSTLTAAEAFAQKPDGWLVILGPPGSGKTHLAAGIVMDCIEANQPALYLSAPDYLDAMRSAIGTRNEQAPADTYAHLADTPLLVLDGLDTTGISTWAKEKVFQIINHRYNSRKPTVITSSSPAAALDSAIAIKLLDPAIAQIHHLPRYIRLPLSNKLPGDEMLRRNTFSNYKTSTSHAVNRKHKAQEYAFSPVGTLTISGQTQTGKTHLAVAIINNILRHNFDLPILFYDHPEELLRKLRSQMSARDSRESNQYDLMLNDIKNFPLLVIDNFGDERQSTWADSVLTEIITYRHDNGKPTILTTHIPEEKMSGLIGKRLLNPRQSILLTLPLESRDVIDEALINAV